MTGLEPASDARRDSNPQYPDPRSDALSIMQRAALPLSYMAGSILALEKIVCDMNVATRVAATSFRQKAIFVCPEVNHPVLQSSVF